MGPRSHEHGNSFGTGLRYSVRRSARFNGAAFSRTRKPDLLASESSRMIERKRASMGPRSHERGNVRPKCWHLSRQKASSFNGAAFSRTRKLPRGSPAMRPRGRLCQASMGPRSHERGNYLKNDALLQVWYQLQWGRVLTNAETSPWPSLRARKPSLQWGRVLTNAETF